MRIPVAIEKGDLKEAYTAAMEALTLQQRDFVEAFMSDPRLRVRAAAMKAFKPGSLKSAGRVGSQTMQRPEVQRAVALALAMRAKRMRIDADWVVRELRKNHKRAIAGQPIVTRSGDVIYKPDLRASNEALAWIGKHVGAFTEKVDVTSKGEQLKPAETQVMIVAGQEVKF